MTTNYSTLGRWQKISRDLGFFVRQGRTYYAQDDLRGRFYLFDVEAEQIGVFNSDRDAWLAAAELAHDAVSRWCRWSNEILSMEKSWMEQGDL